MNKSRKIMLGIAVLLLAVMITVLTRYERFESKPSLTETAIKQPAKDRWAEIDRWKAAASSFQLDANEPIILYKNDLNQQAVYALNGVIRYETSLGQDDRVITEETSQELFKLPGAKGVYWINGDNLLIGVSVEPDNPESYMRGKWYSIQLDAQPKSMASPKVTEIADAYQDPSSVLTVTVTDQPVLFVLAIAEDSERFREYAYRPGDSGFSYINIEVGSNGADGDAAYAKFISLRPEQTAETLKFVKVLSDDKQTDKSLHAFEDDRGTIIAAEWSDNRLNIMRYAGYRAERLVWKRDIVGEQFPLVLFSHSATKDQIVSFPYGGSVSVLEAAPELLDEEWRMVDIRSFYKTSEDAIDTVRYVRGEVFYSPLIRRHFDMDMSLANEEQGLLTYGTTAGSIQTLSVFDLLLGEGSLDQMWLNEPLDIQLLDGYREEHSEPTIKSALPQVLWDRAWNDTKVPEEVQKAFDASDEDCFPDCDPDFADQLQIRSIDGIWYLLQGKQLYRLEGEKFKLITDLPISLKSTFGEGTNGYTAQDFVQADGNWYVTDTFADRVIKLNDKFVITGQLELPVPTHLKAAGKGRLEVVSLKGNSIVDMGKMQIINEQPAASVNVSSSKSTESEIGVTSYYKDPRTGKEWIAVYGNVFVLSKQGGKTKLLQHFIGYPDSGRTIVKIIPYENDIAAVSDYRLERFGANGQWKETVLFPVNESLCEEWPQGENSHVYDPEKGRIFLVHGCGVFQVDMASGMAILIFAQSGANIGKVSLYDGRLVFSVDAMKYSSTSKPYPHSNEIVAIDTASGKITRHPLAKGWISDGSFTGDTKDNRGRKLMSLWHMGDPMNGGTPQHPTATLDLSQLLRLLTSW